MAAFLPQIVFRWYKDDHTPAFGYTAGFYGAGLDPGNPANLRPIYADVVSGVEITNPATFDVNGEITVALGNGAYKVVIRNGATTIATFDNVPGDTAFGSGFSSSIDALRNSSSQSIGFTYVSGYYTSGDGGHGMFYWDAGDSTPDDGGYTITPPSNPLTGRWKRIPDEDGDVRAASFGYVGSVGTDLTTNMVNADGYAASIGARLRIGLGVDAQIDIMTFTAKEVVFEGPELRGLVGNTTVLTFQGNISAPPVKIFRPTAGHQTTIILAASQENARPEWWGAVRDGVTDDIIPIKAMFASGAGSCFFTAGTYLVVGDPLTPAPLVSVIRADGQVQDGPTTYVHFGLTSLTANSQVKADLIEALSTLVVGTTAVIGTTIVAGTGITSTLGNIQATAGQVNAGSSMAAQTTIDTINGGITSGLFLKARAGTGAQRFKAGGNLAAIIGTGSFSLPADTLVATGDMLRIVFDGLCTPTGAQTATFAATFGGAAMVTAAVTVVTENGPYNFRLEVIVKRTAANEITSHAMLISRATNVASILGENTVTNPTLTGACTIASSFLVAAGTNVQTALYVDFFPAAI